MHQFPHSGRWGWWICRVLVLRGMCPHLPSATHPFQFMCWGRKPNTISSTSLIPRTLPVDYLCRCIMRFIPFTYTCNLNINCVGSPWWLTLYQPQILEVSFIACNLLKHTLDKVPIGFHAQNFTQNCTQPYFPHSWFWPHPLVNVYAIKMLGRR